MIHSHKWNYYGKEYPKGHQYRTCEKCSRNETLFHMLHQGVEFYYYDIIKPKISYDELQKKKKLCSILFVFWALSATALFFVYPRIFGANKISFSIPVLFLASAYLLADYTWKIFKHFSVPVSTEKEIEQHYPKKEERLRESQIKAEKILMYRLSVGEINPQEFTERMARL